VTTIAGRLAVLDSCTVSDALDALGLPGSVTGILPVWEGGKAVGRVVTMRTVPADGRPSSRHLGAAAIERAAAGDVIVIQQAVDGLPSSATWGGLLAVAASVKGISGVVIDGACRDIDEIRGLRLPVSARMAIPRTARGRIVEDSVGEPVTIGSIAVDSGDFVIADGSGVVFVGAAHAGEVLTRAERLAAREQLMARDLRAGGAPSQVLGRDYEEMLHER
jgi:regulator of RNase E activity RraA